MMRYSLIQVCLRSAGLCALGAAALALTACTVWAPENSTVTTAAAPVHDSFAAEAAALPNGATVAMPSPLGADSKVAAGEVYTSALGQVCRPVTVNTAGAAHRMSVCQGENGWYTVDPIFEAMPR